jgi:hypothetical protein
VFCSVRISWAINPEDGYVSHSSEFRLRPSLVEDPLHAPFAASAQRGGTAGATPIIDQSYVATAPFNAFIVSDLQTISQTITVGVDGRLLEVLVQLARNEVQPPEGLTLSIVDTVEGVPDFSSVQATAFIAPESVPTSFGFVAVDLSSALLHVSVGQSLAITLTTPAPSTGGDINPYAWLHGEFAGATYSGGQTFVTHLSGTFPSPADSGFATVVDVVPEPDTIFLLSLFLAAASVRRRQRHGPKERRPRLLPLACQAPTNGFD